MKKEVFNFASADKGKEIHAVCYQPPKSSEIKGMVQIIHGFSEHIGRYDSFMTLLANKGYIVFGDDHLGHGLTAENNKMPYSDVGSYKAFDYLLQDEKQLNQLVRQKFNTQTNTNQLPCYILGHSMGSLMLRALLIQEPDICDKAIIMGTGDMKLALLTIFKGILKLYGLFRKGQYKSKLINFIAIGSNNLPFKNEKNPNAWLSANLENQANYRKDDSTGKMGSLHTFSFLQELMYFVRIEENLKRMNKDLPILFVSGQDDAFGDFGKGVENVYQLFKEVGMKEIDLILYPNFRHEILNEKDNEQVVRDLLKFLNK